MSKHTPSLVIMAAGSIFIVIIVITTARYKS